MVERTYWWPKKKPDPKKFIQSRIHCIVSKNGSRRPGLLSTALHGVAPNEVVHADFLYMVSSNKNDFRYGLLIKDDLGLCLGLSLLQRSQRYRNWYSRKRHCVFQGHSMACHRPGFTLYCHPNEQPRQGNAHTLSLHYRLLPLGKRNNWTILQRNIDSCPRFVVRMEIVRNALALHSWNCSESYQWFSARKARKEPWRKLTMFYGSLYDTLTITITIVSPSVKDISRSKNNEQRTSEIKK